ncbi:MAG: hypothetical protein WAM27_11045, partial [Nitrososphaeraceae archaeon]
TCNTKNRIKIWAEAVRCSTSIMKWKWGPINAKVTANGIGGIIMMVIIVRVFFPVQMIQTLTDPLIPSVQQNDPNPRLRRSEISQPLVVIIEQEEYNINVKQQ